MVVKINIIYKSMFPYIWPVGLEEIPIPKGGGERCVDANRIPEMAHGT